MDIMRLFRHFVLPPWAVGRHFSADAMERITGEIAACEARHRGQIRFAVEAALDTRRLLQGESARERSLEVFANLGVWDTEANNGVLIYLLLADHDVEIVADRGIHRLVGDRTWEAICHSMEARFRAGEFEAGVIEGIRAVSEQLERHFPSTGEGENQNELSDKPVVL